MYQNNERLEGLVKDYGEGITWYKVSVIALLLLILFVLIVPAVSPPAWSYKVKFVEDSEFSDELRRLGLRGWEVVAARRAMGDNERYGYELILKRRK
ncbi:MAG: hypothetical protein D6767_09125 [Candidatus Hydrogenedentota bacterium]|nr:MAG: hypothetical protein D6767_09125 [Candidatus Hydrogenedentota bacterium]